MSNLKLSLLFAIAASFSLPAGAAETSKRNKVDGRGFVQAVAKKGGSGVQVAYRVEGAAQPNVPVRVTVEFSGVSAPDGATASLAAEAPAVMSGASTLSLSAGQTRSTSVVLTAPADGTYFVNVTTVQAGRPSVVSLPVKVGAGGVRLERQGTVKTSPNGESVISLPSK